jgi:Lon protease-like protein
MKIDDFPKILSVFPLASVAFFPKTILPLNIFEDRYIQLVNDSMKDQRLFGMVQPKLKSSLSLDVYKVGCLGKITNFEKTNDKRFIITLSGIIRFRIEEELNSNKLYRKFKVNYSDFTNDLVSVKIGKENNNLISVLKKLKSFFRKKNYFVEFEKLEKLNFYQLINTICMIAPFSVEEKQKLIETIKPENKIKVLEKIIDFNLIDNLENKTVQ